MPGSLAETLDRVRAAERSEAELHGYQRDLVAFLLAHPKSAAFVDLGLGKTVSALTVMDRLAQDFAFNRCLVVAPIRVARQTWPSELAKWRHLAGYDYSLIRGEDDDEEVVSAKSADRPAVKEAMRRRALASNAPLHIINREMVDWLVDRCKEERKWPYDFVIIDESSSFKDHSSKRFKALAAVVPYVKRMHQLTATPVSENYLGLYAQFYLLDGGQRFGKTVTGYRERYFTQNQYTYAWKIRPGAEEQITAKIADITIVQRAADHLSLEEPTIINRPVEMTPKQRALYDRMEADCLAEMADGTVIEAVNAGALNSKLTQMASGAVYDNEGRVHAIHDQKIEELKQIVEESRGWPLLVGYWYRSSLERLRKHFPKAIVMDRTGKAVKPWNDGKINMLLGHPAGMAHGLNMQEGPGHLMVFFDLPWSYELYRQFIGRLARQGQKNPVSVFNLVTQRTVDSDAILPALAAKEAAQERLFARLQKLHKTLRPSCIDQPVNSL
jgi:SNF2 family DNA or RNA helicase